jgi:hypothetical protein
MVTGAVFGLALVVTASIDTTVQSPFSPDRSALQMSTQQKSATMRPLVRFATDCIVQAVAADARLLVSAKSGDINELIVTSMTVCIKPVRAMIDAHDRLYGEGSGESFFMGPYLDVLPAAVSKQVNGDPH